MNSKIEFVEQYQRLKELNNGKKPLYRDFLKYCNVHKRKLDAVYGKDAYTKLQQECGDDPNKLQLERTSLKQILDQYGQLVRQHKTLPVTADWVQAGYKPTVEALYKVHSLKWSELPTVLVKEYSGKPEWKDVLEIINNSVSTIRTDKANKLFGDVVAKIATWTPDRKRIIEEGYKIELRNYLDRYFTVEEEVGESNPDLLINNKIPIEVKKDPSQSEYDRLLGQMIRHNKLFGSAVAVVTSISSEDRFKRFQKLFLEVHNKLGMTAELINK